MDRQFSRRFRQTANRVHKNLGVLGTQWQSDEQGEVTRRVLTTNGVEDGVRGLRRWLLVTDRTTMMVLVLVLVLALALVLALVPVLVLVVLLMLLMLLMLLVLLVMRVVQQLRCSHISLLPRCLCQRAHCPTHL